MFDLYAETHSMKVKSNDNLVSVLDMKKISKVGDIWPACKARKSDVQEAINYATISLPWTFDRMRYGPRSQKAVNARLIHILMGVLNQTILERILTKKGFKCSKDWTKYRESDVFDFMINERKYDVKTVHIYSEYNESTNREDFSINLLISNKDYGGPEWRHFFPMMVALSQLTIERMKDSYIFGIAETYDDLREREPQLSDGGFWCAAPFKKAHYFFHSTHIIKQREEEGKGFNVKATWKRRQQRLFKETKRKVEMTLFGEWAGDRQTETLKLAEGKSAVSEKEFSSLSCVKLEHPAILDNNDEIIVAVNNLFDEFISKPTKPLVNLNDPDFEWKLHRTSFVNLQVPKDYEVYWIGYIPFTEFATLFPSYKAYFIPHPNNMSINQPGRAPPRLKKRFSSLDKRREKELNKGTKVPWPAFFPLIDKQNNIKAGLLLAAMRRGTKPIGAACYYYPPYALWESAIYILPGDLYTMDSLPKD